MKIIAVGCLFAIGLWANGQATKTGPATASGGCAVSHSGNNDTIIISNCGIGKEQADKIIAMLRAVLADRDLSHVNAKLDDLLVLASKPSRTQTCVGSNCFQGTNNGTVNQNLNQYGAPKLVIADFQMSAISEAMRPYAGTTITVFCHDATEDSGQYGEKLAVALRNAGISVPPVEYGTIFANSPVSPGVSLIVGADRTAAANALATVMRQVGLIDRPLPYVPNGSKDDFQITVVPNR